MWEGALLQEYDGDMVRPVWREGWSKGGKEGWVGVRVGARQQGREGGGGRGLGALLQASPAAAIPSLDHWFVQ